MKTPQNASRGMWLAALLLVAFGAGCNSDSTSPGVLTTILVAPSPATVGLQATQQFTAVGKDASGNVVTITPTWSVAAGGGTISATGLFTAGATAGTFTNTVKASQRDRLGYRDGHCLHQHRQRRRHGHRHRPWSSASGSWNGRRADVRVFVCDSGKIRGHKHWNVRDYREYRIESSRREFHHRICTDP